MFRQLATALAAAALVAAPALAADAVGKWEATIAGPRGEMVYIFDLAVNGESLSGTISNDLLGDSPITDGRINGDEISFKQRMERGQRAVTFAYTGKIQGDEMAVTRTVEGLEGMKTGGPRPGGRAGGSGRVVSFTARRIE
jgi:hypothetical protein